MVKKCFSSPRVLTSSAAHPASLPRHKEGMAWCWPLITLSIKSICTLIPLYAFMMRCRIMHRDNFISLNKNFIIATTIHHHHNFVLHTRIQNKYHIKLGILLVFTNHHSPYFCTDCTHTSSQKYYLPVNCANPLLIKRQSAFQNYILCLSTELTQPHQKRSSDSNVS